jgi:hypothetical protein
MYYPKHSFAQQKRYVNSLLQSRVCLVGTACQLIDSCPKVAWTVRKYIEVAAAGCVMIGDIPGDIGIARFMQLRMTGQNAVEISFTVEYFMDEYNKNKEKYAIVAEKARNYVLKHFSFSNLIDRYFTPAVNAYRNKQKLLRQQNISYTSNPFGVYNETLADIAVRNDKCYNENNAPKNSTKGLIKTLNEKFN